MLVLQPEEPVRRAEVPARLWVALEILATLQQPTLSIRMEALEEAFQARHSGSRSRSTSQPASRAVPIFIQR